MYAMKSNPVIQGISNLKSRLLPPVKYSRFILSPANRQTKKSQFPVAIAWLDATPFCSRSGIYFLVAGRYLRYLR